MTNKQTYIKDLRDGQNITETFVIAEAVKGQAKNGPYWNLNLQDKSGRIAAKIWYPVSQSYPELNSEQFIQVQAQVSEYREKLQLNIQGLQTIEVTQLCIADYLPCSDPAPDVLLHELEDMHRKELNYGPWKKLCRKILNNARIRDALLKAPGAKSIHHAYMGGLLEHTLNVCKICLGNCAIYPQIDRDILLVAATFHDLGKAFELSSGLSREYTDAGRLLGHIQLGLEELQPFLAKSKDLSEELKMHLKHLILSHHGELEFGSSKRPKTLESFVLHFADNLDAKINTVNSTLAEKKNGQWSGYQKNLERYLFKPEQTPSPTPKTAPVPLVKQRTLFG